MPFAMATEFSYSTRSMYGMCVEYVEYQHEPAAADELLAGVCGGFIAAIVDMLRMQSIRIKVMLFLSNKNDRVGKNFYVLCRRTRRKQQCFHPSV